MVWKGSRKNITRSKVVAVFLIISFILFYSPGLIAAKKAGKGDLIGFVYGEDKTTPLDAAVVKARNVLTGEIVQSTQTNKLGMVAMNDLDVGIYELVISTNDGDFLVNHLVGIKGEETAKISFSLNQAENESEAQQVQEEKKKRRGLIGILLSPVGFALVTAATAGFVVATAAPSGTDTEGSPFK
jgi:hypothetical protein